MVESVLSPFVADLDPASLPPAVTDAASLLLLDGMICMIAGLRSEPAARLRKTVIGRGGSGEASLAGASEKVPVKDAALHNGILTHWSEWDDTYDPGAVHGCAVILPVLLALAEAERIDDPDRFTAAMVAAFEVSSRIGRTFWGKAHRGWMPTGIAGSIGAAAGASRLLGLDRRATRSAMGLVASVAFSSRQPIVERVNAKNCQGGLAALEAVTAIELAGAGIEGTAGFLTGAFGLISLLAPDADAGHVVDWLGDDWQMTEISLKPWPCCRSTHGAIEMALDIREAEGLRAADVASVRLRLSPVMHDLVGAPFAPGDDPRVAAQFSAAYCTALALTRGAVGIDDFSADRVMADRALLDLAARVEITSTPPDSNSDNDPDSENVFAQEMTVYRRDGTSAERSLADLAGMPCRPLDEAAMTAKLLDATRGILHRPERLREACMLRSVPRISALMREARA